jgi:uncharacterized cupin superfamily protein
MSRVSESDLPWTETDRGETAFRRKQLSDAAGGEEIGCSLYEIPAGKRAWPYHYHTGNEEAIYVLDGEGVLRHDGEREPLAAGDYVALPAGEEGGHRVINDTEGPLRYLAISTMEDPDVLVYPDSGKVGLYTGSAPGDHENRELTKYFPMDADVDYWQDEV